MQLTCFEVVPNRVELRAARRGRDWMDATPGAFAHRCLPLTMANAHGWEMLCPFSFEAVWNGGSGPDDVVLDLPSEAAEPRFEGFVAGHFGSGILTFNPSLIFRTEESFNLWLSGPSNRFKDGIAALSACIETDWMPYTFSVNWKFTRANEPVRFEKGEPFCLLFPVARGVVARCEPRLRALDEDEELRELYHWALARRTLDVALTTDAREKFQTWYTRGELPNKTPANVTGHETAIRPKPFDR